MKTLENIFDLYKIHDGNGNLCNLLDTELGKELLKEVKQNKEENYNNFIESVDEYIYGQENQIIKRSESTMSTIKTVVHWCKIYAKNNFT